MPAPFPGMDPWLERSDLWPDVHNGLIAAIRDVLGPKLRPRYFVALEERVYVEEAPGLAFVGRPDLAVVGSRRTEGGEARGAAAVVEVELPIADRVRETYLEVRTAGEGEVVTVLEVLSPANKRAGEGRRLYLQKRSSVLATLTSLVEIDLLRAGESMPVIGSPPSSDYAILVSRSWQRPRAHLLPFGLRDPIPPVPVPLRKGEEEPSVDVGAVLGALYERASYDLRVDYRRPAEPPLAAEDAAWAEARAAGPRSRPG
jgi:hypothetical protein